MRPALAEVAVIQAGNEGWDCGAVGVAKGGRGSLQRCVNCAAASPGLAGETVITDHGSGSGARGLCPPPPCLPAVRTVKGAGGQTHAKTHVVVGLLGGAL